MAPNVKHNNSIFLCAYDSHFSELKYWARIFFHGLQIPTSLFCLLCPRKKVSGKIGEHDKRKPDEPWYFPWFPVCAGQERSDKMKKRDNEKEHAAAAMNIPDRHPEKDGVLEDENWVVRVPGKRLVVKAKENARGALEDEEYCGSSAKAKRPMKPQRILFHICRMEMQNDVCERVILFRFHAYDDAWTARMLTQK